MNRSSIIFMILSISVNLCSFSIGRGQIIDVYGEDIATNEIIC